MGITILICGDQSWPDSFSGALQTGGVAGSGRGGLWLSFRGEGQPLRGNRNWVSAALEKDALSPPENRFGLRHQAVGGGFRHPERTSPRDRESRGLAVINGPRNRGSHPFGLPLARSGLYLSCACRSQGFHRTRSIVKDYIWPSGCLMTSQVMNSKSLLYRTCLVASGSMPSTLTVSRDRSVWESLLCQLRAQAAFQLGDAVEQFPGQSGTGQEFFCSQSAGLRRLTFAGARSSISASRVIRGSSRVAASAT